MTELVQRLTIPGLGHLRVCASVHEDPWLRGRNRESVIESFPEYADDFLESMAVWRIEMVLPGPDRRYKPAQLSLDADDVALLRQSLADAVRRARSVSGLADGATLVESYRPPGQPPGTYIVGIAAGEDGLAVTLTTATGRWQFTHTLSETEAAAWIDGLQLAEETGRELAKQLAGRLGIITAEDYEREPHG